MDWNPDNFYIIKEDKKRIEEIINSNEKYTNYFREVVPYIKKHFEENNVFLELTAIAGVDNIIFRMPGGDPDCDGEEINEFFDELAGKPWEMDYEEDYPWFIKLKAEYRTAYDRYLAGEDDDFEF